mmetsp:Transcript_20540/g.35306  ORF Transcript_20540/g.35306 Transcript_20540/m.35306 type:complete len:85 (+) Transcript_20540:1155-1409(+)
MPKIDRDCISARIKSPVETWFKPNFPATLEAYVPLPAPGAPKKTSFKPGFEYDAKVLERRRIWDALLNKMRVAIGKRCKKRFRM